MDIMQIQRDFYLQQLIDGKQNGCWYYGATICK